MMLYAINEQQTYGYHMSYCENISRWWDTSNKL